jgi:hypothetical protein
VTITLGVTGTGSASGDGSVGNDSFTGVNSGNGGNFADVYNASVFNNGFNSFLGQGGNDSIIGNGATQISFGNATGGVVVDFVAGTADGDGSVGHDTFTGVNSAVGSNFDDAIPAAAQRLPQRQRRQRHHQRSAGTMA